MASWMIGNIQSLVNLFHAGTSYIIEMLQYLKELDNINILR